MSLEIRGLTRRYGGLTAVDAVDFGAPPGTITALIGPNGAGKTTLLNLVSGVTPADAGTVELYGRSLSNQPAHVIARHGISRTYQSPQLFAGMTVLETVMVGAHGQGNAGFIRAILRGPSVRREEAALEEIADRALAFVGVSTGLYHRKATELAYGTQRRVELARALAMRASAILLDEPAAGLIASEIQEIAQLIGRLRDDGRIIVLVEHNMEMVMGISDRVVVMNFGRKIAEGAPAEIQTDQRVLEAYLGTAEAQHA